MYTLPEYIDMILVKRRFTDGGTNKGHFLKSPEECFKNKKNEGYIEKLDQAFRMFITRATFLIIVNYFLKIYHFQSHSIRCQKIEELLIDLHFAVGT